MSIKEILAKIQSLRQKLKVTENKDERVHIMNEILDWEFRI